MANKCASTGFARARTLLLEVERLLTDAGYPNEATKVGRLVTAVQSHEENARGGCRG